ncbi:MAG TPA: KilA-N domain-containing protein [Gallionella sp.]|nr:KilA-N domain-containing protein [Gallionella sp.]
MGEKKTLTLDNITIRQDFDGRYCLNDLHAASGGAKAHQPANFFRQDSIGELCMEMARSSEVRIDPFKVVKGGKTTAQGTYVVRELVYAYAMWISPSFHLKVIRAYDRLATQGVAVHENHTADVLKNIR